MLILPRFFQLFTWTSQEKSVDSTEKGALKLVKLPSLKVTGIKRAKVQLRKVAKISRRLYCILQFNLILVYIFIIFIIFLLFKIHYHVIINHTLPYRKNSENKPRGLYFSKALLRGLSTEGNQGFKIDQASLIFGRKFTIFALFYFVFEDNFPSTSPRGPYIWTGLTKQKKTKFKPRIKLNHNIYKRL